ncbi:putative RNA-binding protein [Cladobotryum mycophilum]|uniref:RNA-binding protein n=1 Tax=Cladobotryum mycophilum TaxID=491253 RepID=A0ABR0T349_9HYPO
MKSKRAAKEASAVAAAVEEKKPVADTIAEDKSDKKRKRSDDDAETNGEVKKSKGDKKDKKDKKKKSDKESRKEKKDKRKNLQDLPEGDDMEVDEEQPKPKESTESEPKKDKKATTEVNGDNKEAKKAERREKKKEKKSQRKENKVAHAPPAKPETTTSNGDNDITPGGDAIDLDESAAQKPGRNIVFVGNLPYSATAATISAHFASLKPIAVRCLTKKGDPNPCRGIAFVEFATPQHQRTCLDKFHHSTFNDGVSVERKINVELTAGGGGKNQNRQNKIFEKNKKLDENRTKRIEKEKTDKVENGGTKDQSQATGGIHPSRLARLPNLGQ